MNHKFTIYERMDKNGNDFNGQLHTRKLLDRFFEGDISSEEYRILLSMARRAAEENSICPDKDTLNGLLLVDSLRRYGDDTRDRFETEVPLTLEARLENHISALATKSDGDERETTAAGKIGERVLKGRIMTRIAASLGAAAVACAIFFSGWHILNDEASLSSTDHSPYIAAMNEPSTPENPSMRNLSDSGHTSSSENTNTLMAVHRKNVSDSRPEPAATIHSDPTAKLDYPMSPDPANSPEKMMDTRNVEKAIAMLPSIHNNRIQICRDDFKVNAPWTDAKAEIDRLLLMPVSTLGESAERVRESIATVADAFSAVADAMEIVNSSLTILPTPGKPI